MDTLTLNILVNNILLEILFIIQPTYIDKKTIAHFSESDHHYIIILINALVFTAYSIF